AIGAVSLWALYRTALLRIATEQPVVHLLVHAHVLVTGCLFTYSIVGSTARRASFARRAAALTMAIAVHSTMAKDLYAHPPHGVPAGQAQAGALVMYYGGDIIEALLMVALFVRWYRATAPRRPAATQAETACSPTVGP
ncbi:MAG: cytochrome c oxidase assembly protein, partial [Acidimicrobiia bacterium]|nr:cytochrome c oxidase assembly protein [Acidimicrobiia bacterium]